MILFATDFDNTCRQTLEIAMNISSDSDVKLFSDTANREQLRAALAENECGLFALSHGRPEYLTGQHNIPAISVSDADVIKCPVFAFACHTGTMLGRELAKLGIYWWGYTGQIIAPPNDYELQALFVPVFQYLRDNFVEHSNDIKYMDFMNNVYKLCTALKDDLEDRYTDNNQIDFEVLMCAERIWNRLRLWLPGSEDVASHPEITSELIIDGWL